VNVSGAGLSSNTLVLAYHSSMVFNADVLPGALAALPWVVLPIIVLLRQRTTRSLADFFASTDSGERVSVVLPARNEANHIAQCVRSLCATAWLDVEIIVVNDHSSDDTRALALEAAGADARVRVIDAPDLPAGWFGKQWACHTGSQQASGSVLLFTDADTRHAPDLIPRMVNARKMREADLLSVAGSQEMQSFWEYAIQPVVFALLLARYGGTAQLENASRATDVIANGQCLMMTRVAYDTIGGHVCVRDTVAEDLMLAQATFRAGLRVSLVIGLQQLSTHMYSGLGAIVKGWMKNVYAGGRLSMWGGKFGRLIYPIGLVSAPLMIALPFFFAVYEGSSMMRSQPHSIAMLTWSTISTISLIVFFAVLNTFAKNPGWRVLLVPVGAVAFAFICVAAITRGQKVEWKGRIYRAS
jgi:chlorobactene glucosyltransferase